MFNYDTQFFGTFNTKIFSDIYPDKESFVTSWQACPLFTNDVSPENIEILYYELMARYANSHIAYYDIFQFKLQMWSKIRNKGPIWQRDMEIQHKLRNLTENELKEVRRFVTSEAANPGQGGITGTENEPDDEILNYINSQVRNKETMSPIDALKNLMGSLYDVTSSFIDDFKKLFIMVAMPNGPLIYENGGEE